MAAWTAGVLGSLSRQQKQPGQLQHSQRVHDFGPSWGTLLEPLQLGHVMFLSLFETWALELETVILAQGL